MRHGDCEIGERRVQELQPCVRSTRHGDGYVPCSQVDPDRQLCGTDCNRDDTRWVTVGAVVDEPATICCPGTEFDGATVTEAIFVPKDTPWRPVKRGNAEIERG